MTLAPEQVRFFETWGYLVLPGLLSDEIGWITEEFEAVFKQRQVVHDGTQRSCIVPFIDQREKLCTLLDHPAIHGLLTTLLGDDFNYLGGDGNFYAGDTTWHSDGFHRKGKFIKVALYLDPVRRESGCLRVIPGTHRQAAEPDWEARRAGQSHDLWGIEGSGVPSMALESNPGDVVAFNHNLMHAAFGGDTRRRMFTLNNCSRCRSPDEIEDLRNYIRGHDRFWIDSMYSEINRSTASAKRKVHLEQVREVEAEIGLPALSAKARERMAEPSRG